MIQKNATFRPPESCYHKPASPISLQLQPMWNKTCYLTDNIKRHIEEFMRKLFPLFAFFVILLFLAACNRAPQPTASPTIAPTFPATPTATTAPSPTIEPSPKTIEPANVVQLEIASSLELPFDPAGIVWGSDGSTLAVTAYKELRLLNADDLTPIKHVVLAENETLLDFSPDGRSLATTVDFQTVTVSDILTGQVTTTISPGVQFAAASFSPDGSQLVIGSNEEWAALIYDAASATLLETVTGFETAAPVYNVRFGSDGASLVWMARGSIQVEQIEGQRLGAYIGHEDFISAYHLAHDGSLLATAAGGTYQGEFTPLVYLWDPPSGEKLAELVQPQPVYSLNFSPDDTLLAVCAGDDLLIWDIASQVQVFSAMVHPGGIWDARFSPGGDFLATVGADRMLHIWTVD